MVMYIPLGTKVILKRLPKPETKPGSILTLSEPKEKLMGIVIDFAADLDNTHPNPIFGVGRIVRYAPFSAHIIDDSDPDYFIVDRKDIWCVVQV